MLKGIGFWEKKNSYTVSSLWDCLGSDGKRQRSAVWRYFIKSENVGMSQCTICTEIVKHANNTSNLFKVLLVH